MLITTQLRLAQELKVSQQLKLSQQIQLAGLLNTPDEVLNMIFGVLVFNPDKVEEKLQERNKEKGKYSDDCVGKIQTLYNSLYPSKGDKDAHGLIMQPDIRGFENFIQGKSITITPDVTYIGRKNNKPEIVYSDHLKGGMFLQLLQVDPNKYPETSKLITNIRNFDAWRREKLIDSYKILGDEQREYFEDFNPSKYNIFTQTDLAEELNLHSSTISRLLSNRWYEARNLEGEQKVAYVKDLCKTRKTMLGLSQISDFNKIFDGEFEHGYALSDSDIASGLNIARRTVAKYRAENKIPDKKGRKRIYQEKLLEESYRVEE